MNAWTILSGLKLFLEIIDGGPSAAVKGVLTSMVPGSDVIESAMIAFELFGLDGSYQGQIRLRKDQYIPFYNLRILDEEQMLSQVRKIEFNSVSRSSQVPRRKFREI